MFVFLDHYPKAPAWWKKALITSKEFCELLDELDSTIRAEFKSTWDVSKILSEAVDILSDPKSKFGSKISALHTVMLYQDIQESLRGDTSSVNVVFNSSEERVSRQIFRSKIRTLSPLRDERLIAFYEASTGRIPEEVYISGRVLYGKVPQETGHGYYALNVDLSNL